MAARRQPPAWQPSPAERAAIDAAAAALVAQLGPPGEAEKEIRQRVYAPSLAAVAARKRAAA